MNDELSMQILNILYPYLNGENKQAIDKAVKALDKQIPKKPVDVHDINHEVLVGKCANCHSGANESMKYCSNCGQALYWETITND